jgi:PTS system galactitol-specific IIC component
VLPFTKGKVVKTFIIGLVALAVGLYFVTDMAPAFTQAAHTVFEQTGDKAADIPAGFEGGALDFASSLFGWVIYKCVAYLKWIGAAVLSLITIGMVAWNRIRIVREEKKSQGE